MLRTNLDQRIIRRARPFVADALERQSEPARSILEARIDRGWVSFRLDGETAIFAVHGGTDTGEVDWANRNELAAVALANLGIWDGFYHPDPILDDDIPAEPIPL